ncbi:MAG: thiamine diphosphokinase [Clostridia bacterium]|nr:thiamine diphosphokinase [Clostridia bacterium]
MNRCVIIGGAEIKRYDRARSLIRQDDFIVCCDSGLAHSEPLGVRPKLIVGDFDSHENPHMDVETIVLPREKDDTDTFYAAKLTLERGYGDFLLLGVAGGRLDHTLGNISLMQMLALKGKKCVAVDDYSDMEFVLPGAIYTVNDSYAYFSLLNVSGTAKGVTIKNAKYPLDDAVIACEYAYAISNEPLASQTAEITLNEGRLLLVRVFR